MSDEGVSERRSSLSGMFNRRRSIVDRLKAASQGIFRRASTSNAIPSELEYDPKIRRKFSVITHDEANEAACNQEHTTVSQCDCTR